MGPIILKQGNDRRTAKALADVNGRATKHTITDPAKIRFLATDFETDLLQRGATKKSLLGATLTYTPGGPGAAYARKAYQVVSTSVTIKRVATGWALVEVTKTSIWADSEASMERCIPADAFERILAKAARDLRLIEFSNNPIQQIWDVGRQVASLPSATAHEKMAFLKALGNQFK